MNNAEGFGECSQYGLWATYDYLTDSCKCMSGYTWGKDIFGNTTCISMDKWCRDKYGLMAKYNILTDSCGCRHGYEMTQKKYVGGLECVSCTTKYGFGSTYDYLTDRCKCKGGYFWGKDWSGDLTCISGGEWCKDKYGYNSKYNSLTNKCECKSGYEMTQKKYVGGLECVSCTSKYGIHSSYSYLSKKCECDDGYTLSTERECVEKQNNVYFILKEIDVDQKRAIIKSEYNYRYYLITYGHGCYASTIRRYIGDRIVVNLGTDFNVDRWDKIVLFDDNEICDIRSIKRVDSDFTLEPDEENDFSYPDFVIMPQREEADLNEKPDNTNSKKAEEIIVKKLDKPDVSLLEPDLKTNTNTEYIESCDSGYAHSLDKTKCIKIPEHAHVVDSSTDVWLCDEGYKEIGNTCILFSDIEQKKTNSDNLTKKRNQQNSPRISNNNKSVSIIKLIFSKFTDITKEIVKWFNK